MKYFLPPYTKENIKKQFREHSKKLHPDKNISGDSSNTPEFIEMLKQYKFLTTPIKAPKKTAPKKKARGPVRKKNNTFVKNVIINIDAKSIEKLIKKYFQ